MTWTSLSGSPAGNWFLACCSPGFGSNGEEGFNMYFYDSSAKQLKAPRHQRRHGLQEVKTSIKYTTVVTLLNVLLSIACFLFVGAAVAAAIFIVFVVVPETVVVFILAVSPPTSSLKKGVFFKRNAFIFCMWHSLDISNYVGFAKSVRTIIAGVRSPKVPKFNIWTQQLNNNYGV